jgi:hypothetical protein
MTPARVNFFSAVIAIVGSIILVVTRIPSAYIWFAASIVWFVLAAGRHIVRRLARLALFS